MSEIERLQQHLRLIRRAVGWNAEELGDRIGVTRQTINNLEANEKSRMSKTQYIAIRAVLDAEIASSPKETELLRLILEVFVDNPEKYNNHEKELLLSKANMLTPSILAGTSKRKDVSEEMMKAAKEIGLITAVAAISATVGPIVGTGAVVTTGVVTGVAAWLAEIAKKRK